VCRLIMMGIGGAKTDATETFRQHGFYAEPADNPTASVIPGDTRLKITRGGCSCDFYPCHESWHSFDASKQRRRYERQGWTESKIDRAVEAARISAARPRPVNEAAEAFASATRQLVAQGTRVTLLGHFFDGHFTEPFRVAGRITVAIDEFFANGDRFPDDTLVTLVA